MTVEEERCERQLETLCYSLDLDLGMMREGGMDRKMLYRMVRMEPTATNPKVGKIEAKDPACVCRRQSPVHVGGDVADAEGIQDQGQTLTARGRGADGLP